MNDKQQLAAMGEHMAEQAGQAKPLCMAKRIEELEAQVRVMAGLLLEATEWMEDHPAMPDSSRMRAALSCSLPAPSAPEGWKLVPVEPTEEILRAIRSAVLVESCYRAMLAAAPKPEAK